MSRDLVTVGDINWDTIAIVPRIPGPDEEVEIISLQEAPGGDAANVAVAFARLGGKAGMIGAVGTDSAGEALMNHLTAAGVDIQRVLVLNLPSGHAFSLVEPNGVRHLLYTRGANAGRKLSPSDLEYVSSASWLYVADPIPNVVDTLSSWYRKEKRLPKLVLDPGSGGAARGMEYFSSLLSFVSILLLNEIEALTLSAMTNLNDAIAVLKKVCPIVVVKQGERGALLSTRDGGKLNVPAFPVQAIDTTGCGDAFNAALLFALTQGKSLYEAAQLGNAAGALTAKRTGAYAPTREEVEELLSRSLYGR